MSVVEYSWNIKLLEQYAGDARYRCYSRRAYNQYWSFREDYLLPRSACQNLSAAYD